MQRRVQPTSEAVRAANRARVVDILRRSGSATRAELVSGTGLSRATVSSLIGELADRGLVSELPQPAADAPGRPPTRLALNRAAGLAIAVDVGVRHVAVAVGDLSRSVLAERWVSLPQGHSAERGTHIVMRSIETTLAEAEADRDQIVGAAISIAAPIAPDSGRFLVPGVLPGWNGSELAELIGRTWGIPAAVENDANLGALGESVVAAPPGGDPHGQDLLYVKLASRVGLGIAFGSRGAFGSRIHRGHDGYAGELGHVTADPDGPACWCGRRGCLELYAGAEGMLARLAARGIRIDDVNELIRRAEAGDADVLAVIGDGTRRLARSLGALALVLNPSVIILGGELTALGPLLLDPVHAELAAVPFGAPVAVRTSTLGPRASLMGALALVLSESSRFTDQSSAPVAANPGRVTAPAAAPSRSLKSPSHPSPSRPSL
ncbi:putative NBD/HSP70 family sugar kinase [Catenulispora sp. EB89]|uniref:ROK family transcriptional regulator n=1 Tax=Catenulispora sp. EB89 TaxID=3156257 RepID=UPI003516C948